MQHLNPFRFYELAAKLHSFVASATQSRVADMFGPLTDTQTVLDSLIKGDPVMLESSKADATRLLKKISALFDKYFIDPSTKQIRKQAGEDRIDQHEIALVSALVEKFEQALAADLGRAPTYVAQKCGIYSTYDLVENAHHVFSSELQAALTPAALKEFNVAGRALAFGLGTAAGLHLLRAIEMTLKQYFELFVNAGPSKTERNYNIYLKKLASLADDETNTNRPDRRLLQMLAQIKEHYRSPIVSVDTMLSVDQAISLFSLATAAISLMGERIFAEKKGNAKEALADVLEEGDEGYDFRMSQAS